MFMNEIYYVCFVHITHVSFYQHMIVICTHLHKALSVCTYAVILCHIWFFLYMCMCQNLPENNEKLTRIIKLIQFVSIWVSVSVMILLILFFFSVREINLWAENSWVHCEVWHDDEFMLIGRLSGRIAMLLLKIQWRCGLIQSISALPVCQEGILIVPTLSTRSFWSAS